MYIQSADSQVLISFIEVDDLFEINFAIYNDREHMAFYVVDKIGEDKIAAIFLHYYKHLQAIFPNVNIGFLFYLLIIRYNYSNTFFQR